MAISALPPPGLKVTNIFKKIKHQKRLKELKKPCRVALKNKKIKIYVGDVTIYAYPLLYVTKSHHFWWLPSLFPGDVNDPLSSSNTR